MHNKILSNLTNPAALERLYRSNKSNFKKEFSSLYPEVDNTALVQFWYERLNYEIEEVSWGSKNDIFFILLVSIIAGLLAKIPEYLNISEDFFYPRNAGFLVLPFITVFFAWKNNLSQIKIWVLASAFLLSIIYINLLPENLESDTIILACIHLPFILWVLAGVSYISDLRSSVKKMEFLRFNGDAAVMTALLLIACGLLTGITIGLFELIKIQISEFYFNYVVIFCLPAIPIIAVYLTQTNPQLVNRVSPIIARIFSPIVLVMLIVYLITIIFSGKDFYNDREFLLLFNILLIGVMALIFFSVAENFTKENAFGKWIVFLLALVTICVNGIALSAILFRISEWGFTPNRLAVLGGNIVILIHLLIVSFQLLKTIQKRASYAQVGNTVTKYIPVYFVWACIVVFLFPILFKFQ
tara:strand:+ start:47 stop:1285 length:1239 start_codon:yes stop_codon:yes gene_type:complete